MTRNLKVLGLALVAAFALSAIAASGASASAALFTCNVTATETCKIHGGQSVETGDEFIVNEIPLKCDVATLTGEAETQGTQSTAVVLTPTYEKCHALNVPLLGTRTATVTVNGCTYTFNATKNTNSASNGPTPNILTPWSADLHINCPTGAGIEVHIYNTNLENDTGASVLCTYKIDPQTILNQIQLTNEAGPPTDILAHVHAFVAVTKTAGSLVCGPENQTATYKGTDTLTATNEAGVSVNSSVS